MPSKIEFYSLFALRARRRDVLTRRELPRIPSVPMGDWILVAGSWGISDSWQERVLVAVRKRWPDCPVVYLQHPGETGNSLPNAPRGVEVVASVGDWRELILARGSFPLATVSFGSTLAYLVRFASGFHTSSVLIVSSPLEQIDSADLSFIDGLVAVDGWGPRDLIIVGGE
ncbi:MAG: hypothetical protein WCI74_01415 [Actinomycetes bacterium]